MEEKMIEEVLSDFTDSLIDLIKGAVSDDWQERVIVREQFVGILAELCVLFMPPEYEAEAEEWDVYYTEETITDSGKHSVSDMVIVKAEDEEEAREIFTKNNQGTMTHRFVIKRIVPHLGDLE